ncbi:MAG TPA: T9SS type A sorting domain-containing protein [Bacteroidia bacterium]|jgi:polyhydroxybutyrate depolymerase|nr:T9SS type A sorting domain-containing protein [Bacteroidia bacterium]
MQKAKLYLSLFILTGFFVSAQTGVTDIDSIYSNSIYRTYRLYKPTSYTGSQPYPLVINLHGYTSNSFQQQYYGNFMPVADTAKFLIVHPQGTNDPSNQPYWNAGISSSGADDLLFLSELIDSLKTIYNIDPNAIYSTGLSNGGFMSNYLACNLSNKIAAIAGVAGTMFTTFNFTCNPGRPVPVMHIHGTADGTVPYGGNAQEIAVDTLMKLWRIKNNCNPVPTSSAVPNINTSDGCTADHFLWSGGTAGSTNELYRVNGGAHTWPGATTIIGVTNEDFNASVEIWRFFRKYKLNMFTGINEFGVVSLEFVVSPNPATDQISIKTDKEFTAKLFDVFGKEVVAKTNLNSIDISFLNPGVYFLRINSEGNYFTKKLIKE